MPRLIDDLRSMHRFAMPWFVSPDREQAWIEYASHVWPLLGDPQMPVILVDNVADYYYQSEQEVWDLMIHFPNMAPPYERFWIEHRMPSKIQSKEAGDSDMSDFIRDGRVGMLMIALPPEQAK